LKKILFLVLFNTSITFAQTQVGADINGEAANDQSGFSVSMSSDGSVVAIGATRNNGNGLASGHVRVYQNVSGAWTQVGADINGEAADDLSGFSVSMSSDGSVVAIGAIGNNGNGSVSGHVRVYQNVSGTWTQVGADINGEAASDQSGISVSMSSDGSVVAIGATRNDGNGSNSGHVRVYNLAAVLKSDSFVLNNFLGIGV
jgi:Flp pilus assembly pilin Flp